MINLLSANFLKLRKSKGFWFCILLSFVFAMYAELFLAPEKALETYLGHYMILSGFIIAIFSTIFISTEYSEMTLRNKIAIGHKRTHVYLANLITIFVANLIFYVAYAILVVLLARVNAPRFVESTKMLIKEFSGLLVICVSYTSIFTFVSMVLSNKVVTSIINIVMAFLLLILPFKCSSTVSSYYSHQYAKIHYPETVDETWDYTYPSKEEAEFSKVIIDVTPLGRFIQLGSESDYYTKDSLLCVYSALSLLLINGLGLVLFNKKELR